MSFGRLGALGTGFSRLGSGGRGSSLLAAPATPTLTLISGATDNTPDFTYVASDLAVNDVVRVQYSTDPGFSGASEITNTIDAGEDAANELDFSTGTLADGTWYFRARTERTGHTNGGWSNTQTETIDTTAPTLSSPTGAQLAQTTASLSVSSNEANGTLYWVVTTSATPPSKAQVKAGQNNGGTAALASGSQAVSATGAQAATATGVTVGTRYAYFMQEDAVGNQSSVSASSSWSQADITAPVLSSPTDVKTGSTTADVGATTDSADGTLFVAVTPTSTPPSSAQIIAGSGGGIVVANSASVSSTGVKAVGVTGLTASTSYFGHSVHRDAASNVSNVVTGDGFTTDAATAYVTGDQTAFITVTDSGILVDPARDLQLVNGDINTGNPAATFFGVNGAAAAGEWIKYTLVAPKVVDEAKWYQNTAESHGVWKWQGSADGSSWTDIGGTFTLGGAAPVQIQTTLNGNTTAYLHYRQLGVSGNVSDAPYLEEIEFKRN